MEARKVVGRAGGVEAGDERVEHLHLELGGQFRLAMQIPGKEEFKETIRYYTRMLDKHRVDVRLGVEVTHVDVTDATVTVRGPDCHEEGTHVVVAVPLGVLKGGVPAFTPGLPSDRVDAIAWTRRVCRTFA